MSKLRPIPAIRSFAVLGLAIGAAACASGDNTDLASPSSGMAPHQPNYVIMASIEPGEMEEKTGPDHVVVQGEAPNEPAHQPWTDPTMDSAPTGFEIDASLASACQIPKAEAFFDTESADLPPTAQAALKAMYECFSTGPMKGHRLAIVGHTDPQGSAKYNKTLGQQRAEAVAAYLEGLGMASQQMEAGSAGESEASDDPAQWPYDRKVVLDIAEQEDEPAEPATEAPSE